MSQAAMKPPAAVVPTDLGANTMRTEIEGGTETEAAVARLIFAAGEGHTTAQLILGLRYLVGDGVPRRLPRAVHWFRMAAERDDARAQYWLACCYLTSQDARHKHRRAYFWCRMAIANGHPDAGSIADGVGQHLTPEERRWTDAEVRAVLFRRR